MQKIVVFISGRGTNLSYLVDFCERGFCAAKVVAVISDRPDAPGLNIALQKKIPIIVVDRRLYPVCEAFDYIVEQKLDILQPNWLVLAGFMKRLGARFVKKYEGKLINIHPSLLPSFPGLDTHHRALLAGVKWHGATVHFVNEELDAGSIIAQTVVPVYLHDTVDTLQARVLSAEHNLLPKIISLCVEGKITLDNGDVKYDRSLIENSMSYYYE